MQWEKKFWKIRMGGRETHPIVKPMIFKVKDMEEPSWRGEGRGPTEVKHFSRGRGTSTALKFMSQGGVCTSVPPITDGEDLDGPHQLP